MKKYLLISLLAVICLACKKDKPAGKQLLLSKVYEDGLLQYEYSYDANKKPQRRNVYNTNNGQSVYTGFKLYVYENGLPKEVTDFNENNNMQDKYVLTYDQNKRVSRLDYYTSSNTLYTYYTFDYNQNGKLIGYLSYNASTNKKGLEAKFKYDQQGLLTGTTRYSWATTAKFDSTNFVFGNKTFPTWWSYYEMLPFIALPNGDKIFYDMILTSSFHYVVDAPPFTSEITYSNKVYNNEGLLIKQTISYKTTNGFAPILSSVEKTYEYTE